MNFEKWIPVDLLRLPAHVQDIGMPVYTGDNLSVRVGAKVTKDGVDEAVTGTVSGYVILPNGTTIATITGTASGNLAWIDLPEDAFVLPGRIQIAIRVTDGTTKTVLLAATATVRPVATTTAYDPDGEIPTWDEIEAKIEAIDDAVEQASSMVSYAAQTGKTDAQKAQARENIGAANAANLKSINITSGILAGTFSGSALTIASSQGASSIYFPVVSGKKYAIVKPSTTTYWRVGFSTTEPAIGTTLTNYDGTASTSSAYATYTAPVTGYLVAYVANNNIADKPAFDAALYAYEGEYNAGYNINTAMLKNTNVPENLNEILGGLDADIDAVDAKIGDVGSRLRYAFTDNDVLNVAIHDCKINLLNSSVKKVTINIPQNVTTYLYLTTYDATDTQIEKKTVLFSVYCDTDTGLLLVKTSDYLIRMIMPLGFVSGNHAEYTGTFQSAAYSESELFDVRGYPYDKHITGFGPTSSGDPLTAYMKLRDAIQEVYVNSEAITVTGIDILAGPSIRLKNGSTNIITKTLSAGYKGPVLFEDYCAMYVDLTNFGTGTLSGVAITRTGIADNPVMTSQHVFYCGPTREITTLKGGIEAAVQYMGSILYVDEGTYDLLAEFGSDYFANLPDTDQQAGLKLGNRIHVIFSANSIVTCLYEGDNENVCTCFSPFNQDNRYGFTLENLTLFSARTRYGVHDVGGTRQCVTRYINCHIEEDNSDNPYWATECAIAAGLGNNHEMTITDCVFHGRVYWHVSSGESSNFKATVRCVDNYFLNETIQVSVSRDDASLDTDFVISGNSIVPQRDSDADGIVRSTTGGGHYNIYAWNNEVRES